MTYHVLKCWEHYWNAIERGDKNFEVRLNDRGFQRGDVLILRCTSPNGELLRLDELRRRVTYVLYGGQFGIIPGYVVMGLKPVDLPGGYEQGYRDAEDDAEATMIGHNE